jgi:hypothetical protein
MKRGNRNTRVPRFVLLNTLIFCWISTTAPSDPITPEFLADAPSAEEIALFEELAGWIDGTVPGAEPRPVREAIRDSESFDLFRAFHRAEQRFRRLEEVPYGDAIRRAAERYDVDPLLLAAVAEVESSFDPKAVSRRGAVGLMQLLPTTAAVEDDGRLTDPYLNAELGARYLRRLLTQYGGDLELALAAYNAGPGNVRRFGGVPPFRETRRYVEKVLGLYVEHHRQVWRQSDTGEFLLSG